VTIAGRHVLIRGARPEPSAASQHQGHKPEAPHPARAKSKTLPASGLASIYADLFVGRKTASGEVFDQNGYTAALLPRSRWHAVRLGTHVELTSHANRVVVEINDRGVGDKNPYSTRALDLSRAAASALTGQDISNDDDAKKIGLIRLDKIRIVSADTPLGPVRH
jgi:rare lipoprotein A